MLKLPGPGSNQVLWVWKRMVCDPAGRLGVLGLSAPSTLRSAPTLPSSVHELFMSCSVTSTTNSEFLCLQLLSNFFKPCSLLRCLKTTTQMNTGPLQPYVPWGFNQHLWATQLPVSFSLTHFSYLWVGKFGLLPRDATGKFLKIES